MFRKILVANYGEIAVRIIRTCREMGIPTIALYEPGEIVSLHVRLADECAPLNSTNGYSPQEAILQIARERGADAIHPGYGFLAEQPGFSQACQQAGIVFIGPPAEVMAATQDKSHLLEEVRQAGISTIDGKTNLHPLYMVGVQILADNFGNQKVLGDFQSVQDSANQVILQETPAPCLTACQREYLQHLAGKLANRFQISNAATVEFLVDDEGRIYFSEIKSCLNPAHPLVEVLANIDLVREQIRIAAGCRLNVEQLPINLGMTGMMCRLNRVVLTPDLVPFIECLENVRLPNGPGVRVDTAVYPGFEASRKIDPLIARITVWDRNRASCLNRMQRTVKETRLTGIRSNLVSLLEILWTTEFAAGNYPSTLKSPVKPDEPESEICRQDLAVIAALLYERYSLGGNSTPNRFDGKNLRNNRRFDQEMVYFRRRPR